MSNPEVSPGISKNENKLNFIVSQKKVGFIRKKIQIATNIEA